MELTENNIDNKENKYAEIGNYFSNHNLIKYSEFNNLVEKKLILFKVENEFDFKQFDQTLNYLKKYLPYIKNIFKKPIIHLIENNEVLPLDSVISVDSSSINHLANHSENIEDITRRGIRPSKLLTQVYEDNYCIYENVMFCNLVDKLIGFLKKHIRIFKEIVYVHQYLKEKSDMVYDLLETINHYQFYISLGKLQSGYMRDSVKYVPIAKKYIIELENLLNVFTARLKKPVYQLNKNRSKNLKLKKTNIFAMDKNYHQIYLYYKKFDNLVQNNQKKFENNMNFENDYFYFVECMFIFSISNFNFESSNEQILNFDNIDIDFTFMSWKLNIFSKEIENHKFLILKMKKEIEYTVCILLENSKESIVNLIKNEVNFDEYLIASDNEENIDKDGYLLLSIENIDTFRRIQQVIQRMMIYSSICLDICPFCGSFLKKDNKKSTDLEEIYVCENCRNIIHKSEINEKPYYFITILGLKPKNIDPNKFNKDNLWIYKRQKEGLYHFRNITKIENIK